LSGAVEKIKSFGTRSQQTKRFEWSPSGENIAALNPQGHLSIWDVPTARIFREVSFLDTELQCLAWSPDSRRVAVGADNGTVIYDVEDLRKLILGDHAGSVVSVAWSPNGHLLATGATDRAIRIRDGSSGESRALLLGHDASVTALSWAHDGEHLASASSDGTLRLWTRSGEAASSSTLIGRVGLRDIDWSPDDKTIAVAAEDGSVQIVDAALMRPMAILEGHTGGVTTVSYSAGGELLLSRSQEGTIRIWSVESWKALLVAKDAGRYPHFPTARFHPGEPQFACLKGSSGTVEIWKIDIGKLLGATATAPSIHYTNAKIVLLGDTGVGKSGLGLVLTGQPYSPTDSTHARKIWRFDSDVVKVDKYRKEVRETVLWDLAGQPGYRLVHQLSLNEIAVALLVFDSRSETDPFGSVRYWDRAVRLEQAKRISTRNSVTKFLVAARVDRGGIGVSQKRIDRFVQEIGAREYFATSAKEGTNVAQLRSAIGASIDWENLPKVTSTELFNNIKTFLIDQKQKGSVLVSFGDLYRLFIEDSGVRDSSQIQAQFTACIRLVEARGLIRRLSFGDLVLLQPELLDVYASAMVNEAREEPDGLGYLIEDDAKEGKFPIPREERVADRDVEKLLLISTIEELFRHEVAFRDTSGAEAPVVVFPAQFTREWPEAPDPAGKAVVFSFEGPVASAYCTLVIRLARSGSFRLREMWKNAVVYDGPGESTCGVFLQGQDEGRADLTVFYRGLPDSSAKIRFEEFVHTHLLRKTIAQAVKRRAVIVCDDCQTEVTAAQVRGRRERGFEWTQCNVCGASVSLSQDTATIRGAALAEIAKMDRAADALRDRDVATETLDGKVAVRDFDVFLCHNSKDKAFVREVCQQLKGRGILPWVDEEQIRPGQSWQRVLESDIKRIKCAAVFVGASGVGPWQSQEIQAFLQEFVSRKRSVIPVILPYDSLDSGLGVRGAPRRRVKVPIFLKNLQWVDFRDEESRPFDRLVWGITGVKVFGEKIADTRP
jgi:WD40 repeat protein